MTDTLFCYCCRVHHPKDQMRLFPTRQGNRWRCLRSIEAAASNRGERDAFGRRQTDINRDIAVRAAEYALRLNRTGLQPG
ncbi:MAG: hypothetical protein KA538_13000 [Azonexus sp.]|jgi:hypothetical protein|nr:hypothetical protein [Azonexus sp.]